MKAKRPHSQGLDQLGALGIRPFSPGYAELRNAQGGNGFAGKHSIRARAAMSAALRKKQPITLPKLNLPKLNLPE